LSIPWSRYTDAPFVKLELNGKEVVAPIAPPEFGNAQFSIPYAPGYVSTFCFEPFIYKTIILPRQARDKHRENSKKTAVFSQESHRHCALLLVRCV
jgi:hypothetical protein